LLGKSLWAFVILVYQIDVYWLDCREQKDILSIGTLVDVCIQHIISATGMFLTTLTCVIPFYLPSLKTSSCKLMSTSKKTFGESARKMKNCPDSRGVRFTDVRNTGGFIVL